MELITCSACGRKNHLQRTTCVSCGGKLSDSKVGTKTVIQGLAKSVGSFIKSLSLSIQRRLPLMKGVQNFVVSGALSERIKQDAKRLSTTRVMRSGFISAISLIGVAVFYYLVIFEPKREEARRKAEQARIELQKREAETRLRLEEESLALVRERVALAEEEKADAEFKESANRRLLAACLSSAYETYRARATQIEARLKAASQTDGVTPQITFRQLLDVTGSKGWSGLPDEVQTKILSRLTGIPLMTANAQQSLQNEVDRLISNLDRQKDECYKRFPQR